MKPYYLVICFLIAVSTLPILLQVLAYLQRVTEILKHAVN